MRITDGMEKIWSGHMRCMLPFPAHTEAIAKAHKMGNKDDWVFVYKDEDGKFILEVCRGDLIVIDPWTSSPINAGIRHPCCDLFDALQERDFQILCIECPLHQDEPNWSCPEVADGQQCGYGKSEQDEEEHNEID